MGSPSAHIHVGSVMSTGAALTVECGFPPRIVQVRCVGTQGHWQEGMPDGSAHKTDEAVASVLTTTGITPGRTGFVLGTDADLNPASATRIDYVCYP